MRRRGPAPPPRRPPFARRSCTGSFSPTHAQPQCFAAARATRLVLASVCVGLPEPYLQHALCTAATFVPREVPNLNTPPSTDQKDVAARATGSCQPVRALGPQPPSLPRARPRSCRPRPMRTRPARAPQLPAGRRLLRRPGGLQPTGPAPPAASPHLPWAGRARACVACRLGNVFALPAAAFAGGALTGVATAARASDGVFSARRTGSPPSRRGGPRRGPRRPPDAREPVPGRRGPDSEKLQLRAGS